MNQLSETSALSILRYYKAPYPLNFRKEVVSLLSLLKRLQSEKSLLPKTVGMQKVEQGDKIPTRLDL